MQSLNRMTAWNQARKQETSQYIGNWDHIWTFADTQHALVGGASPASWTRWAKPPPRKETPFLLHLIHLLLLLFSIMCSNWQMPWLKTGSVNHTWCFSQHCLGVGCWSHIAENSPRLFRACHSDAKTDKWQTWGAQGDGCCWEIQEHGPYSGSEFIRSTGLRWMFKALSSRAILTSSSPEAQVTSSCDQALDSGVSSTSARLPASQRS